MNNEFEKYDLFARYFNKELSVEELAAFEQELLSNTSFQQAFDEYKFSQELLVTQELTEVQDILDSFEYPVSTPTNTPFYKHKLFFIGLGVSILTIGSLASSLFPKHTKETSNLDLNTPSIVSTPHPLEKKQQEFSPSKVEHNNTSLPKDTTSHTKQYAQEISHDSITTVKDDFKSLHKDFTAQYEVVDSVVPDVHAEPLALTATTSPSITTKSTLPCNTIDIQYNLVASCEEQENGKIDIIQSKNGTAPYQYALNNKEWQDYSTYENLASGNYTLFVKDKNGCESQKNIAILEKKCYSDIYYIIPSQGVEWEIPVNDGKITILDKRGKLIHELVLENDTENIWDGNTSNGFLKAGLYVFYIESSNGELLLKGKLSVQP